MFGEELRRVRLASISPVTSQVLQECGHKPAVEAKEYTTAGLTAAITASVMDRWQITMMPPPTPGYGPTLKRGCYE